MLLPSPDRCPYGSFRAHRGPEEWTVISDPVYISEISPANARGWQASLYQLAITIGILSAYLVDYAFAGSENWRWMLGLAAIPGMLLGLGMIALPETPRWLLERGRVDDARKVLRRIRGNANIDAEFQDIQNTLSLGSERGRFSDLLTPAIRRSDHRHWVGRFPAGDGHQYGYLLRPPHYSGGRNFVGFRSDSCDRRHWPG